MNTNIFYKYKMFSDCLIAKGFNRSILLDTSLNKYHLVPNALADILETKDLIDFNALISGQKGKDRDILIK